MHQIIKFREIELRNGRISLPRRGIIRTPGWIGARMNPTHTHTAGKAGIIFFLAVDSFIRKQIVAAARSRPVTLMPDHIYRLRLSTRGDQSSYTERRGYTIERKARLRRIKATKCMCRRLRFLFIFFSQYILISGLYDVKRSSRQQMINIFNIAIKKVLYSSLSIYFLRDLK